MQTSRVRFLTHSDSLRQYTNVTAGRADFHPRSTFIAGDNENLVTLGIGVQWHLGGDYGFAANYDRYGDDIDLFSLGIYKYF